MKKNIRNISGMAAVLMAAIIISSSTVSAYDPPKVTKDLARMPISCSIYPSQAQIGGIRAGINPKKVRSVLVVRSVRYLGISRRTMKANLQHRMVCRLVCQKRC